MADPMDAERILGRTWRLTRIDDVPVSPDWPAEITFGHDGTLTGCDSVNRLSGVFTLTGSTVVIGPLATTLMAGPPEAMDQERAVLRALAGEVSVRAPEAGWLLLEPTNAPVARLLLADVSEAVQVPGGVSGSAVVHDPA